MEKVVEAVWICSDKEGYQGSAYLASQFRIRFLDAVLNIVFLVV